MWASGSARRPRHARIACRPNRDPTTSGSRVTSIPRDRTTPGTTATGRVRPTKARTGWRRTTPTDNTSPAAGRALAETCRTTIAGTGRNSAINIAILAATTDRGGERVARGPRRTRFVADLRVRLSEEQRRRGQPGRDQEQERQAGDHAKPGEADQPADDEADERDGPGLERHSQNRIRDSIEWRAATMFDFERRDSGRGLMLTPCFWHPSVYSRH